MNPTDLPLETCETFYCVLAPNGTFCGFMLDADTACAKAELEGGTAVKRTVTTRIERAENA